jgi:protein SCO1/2
MDVGFFKKSIPTLRFLIVFSFVGITVFYKLMSQEERLKIYNPIDINPRLVDISVKNLK